MRTQMNTAWPQLFLTLGRAMIDNQGEDSFCYSLDPQNQRGMIAALDGCGGSGARRYQTPEREHGATGAYIASRTVAFALYKWYEAPLHDLPESPLHAAIEDALREAAAAYPPMSSLVLGGSLMRAFPTTLSAAIIQNQEDGAQLRVIWAGDSRCYLFTPDGLTQLTRDDLAGGADAMENIFYDSPMSNVVCADRPFTLNERTMKIKAPYILLTATDGFFGAFPSPMDFEHFLLRTLCQADTPGMWRDNMRAELDPIAIDDDRAVILGSGFASFTALRDSFRSRLAYIESTYITPMNEHTPRSREQMMDLWQRYKPAYEGACDPE